MRGQRRWSGASNSPRLLGRKTNERRSYPLPHCGRGRDPRRRRGRVRVFGRRYPHPASGFALRHPLPRCGRGSLTNAHESYSIDTLQCRRLALLDPGAALVATVAEQLVRQPLVTALLAGIGRLAAAQPALGDAQPGGGLLARLAWPGGVDRLARPVSGARDSTANSSGPTRSRPTICRILVQPPTSSTEQSEATTSRKSSGRLKSALSPVIAKDLPSPLLAAQHGATASHPATLPPPRGKWRCQQN